MLMKVYVATELPTVQEVCAAYGLEDVKIEYDDFGVESLTNYRSFTQHVRPILSIENPKVCFQFL